jgi:phosphonate degradation associated HDIG domain protein
MGLSLADIASLFERHGGRTYVGGPVSQLEHALQSAQLAEDEDAGAELVTAALLHDVGHLLAMQRARPVEAGTNDQHEYLAIPFLRPLFPAGVVEPIRLHVEAKRALCALEPSYQGNLLPDSRLTLGLQGGPLSPESAAAFLAKPNAHDAVRLRRWDDAAKRKGVRTNGLDHFLAIAAGCVR